ncbi:interactor of constitutive active ROPs 2, chloroplastic-like [Bidens hawaiensis]|uniref:interactor of constitutive active ROPs 2, chloroplastic-like n=1 Tax=Bidens hawaiensis TaxID=980011 RepID=UPI00404B81BB
MQHPKTRGGTTRSDTKPRTSGPKVVDHRGQRAPTSEKQLAQLQEELKKTKDQLRESESCTKTANQEAEEAKKQLAAMSAKFHESQNQLDELWTCEESRIQELRKISKDRDRAWESELKAVQKHLATAINENQKLNSRLQKLAESESAHAKQAESAQDEIMTLKLKLSENVYLVEQLNIQLKEYKDSESRDLESRDLELASALAAGAEMENELRKLKVQAEQWRKAAEAAAAMVMGGGGGKFIHSLDFNVVGEKSSSDDTEDESSIKKTSNMLKKIGVLLKKGQK